ncbi:MAG: hypothetical protein ABIP93_10700 [Gemmatimonadaceae bacterium]
MARLVPRSQHAAPSEAPRTPPRIARFVLTVVVLPILLGLVIVSVLAMTPWGNERVRRVLVSQANERMNGTLAVGALRGNLLSGATMTDVRLLDSARRPLLTARRAQVRYALWRALQGRVVIRSLVLDTPVVVLDKQPGARWNFQSLMRARTTPKDTSKHGVPPELSDITVHHGRMIYRRPWNPDTTLTPDRRDSAIARALAGTSRKRTERVAGGFQRVLDYHDLDARLSSVRLAREGRPTAVDIASLSMLAEPYRPPAIDVRSLVGTLYASKDSLWWRGARMTLPNSKVSGDGTIGFRRTGFRLDLTGAPVALADLRWLNPSFPESGGGAGRYTMRIRGDTTALALTDADVRYRDASLVGRAAITRIAPKGGKTELLIDGADLTVTKLSTAIVHELAPTLPLRRAGTLDGHLAVSGPPSALVLDADLRFDDVAAGRSHVLARGGVGLAGGVQTRDLAVQLQPLQLATLSGAGLRLPIGGVVTGDATVSGAMSEGWRVRGELTHVDGGARSRVSGVGSYGASSKRIVADARFEPLALVAVGRLAPSARLRGAVTGRVHLEGTTRDLRLAGALRSTTGGGAIDARGTIALRGSRTRYDLTAVTDALNAGAFSGHAPSTHLTGTIVARGSGFKPATANAVVSADLVKSRYDTFVVDRLSTRLSVSDGLLRVDTLAMLARGARASAAGSLGLTSARTGTLRFSATVDSLGALRPWLGTSDTSSVAAAASRQRTVLVAARADSARRADALRIEQLALGMPVGVPLVMDTLPRLRRDSLAGTLSASGELRGNIRELGVNAMVEGSELVVRGSSVQRVAATVSSDDVRRGDAPLRFRLAADTVETTGRVFERVQTEGRWRNKQLAADVRIRQDSLVQYAASGTYARPASGVYAVRLDSMRASFDTLVWRLAHAGGVRLDHESVAVDSIDLRSSGGGRLFASGVVPKSGPIALDVTAENVRVATVLQAMQRDADTDGIVALNARMEGTRALPLLAGKAMLRAATYRDVRAPDADVSITYRDRRIALDAIAHDSGGRRVLTGKAALPFDLAFEGVAGSRRIEGPLIADVVLDSLSLAALPLDSRKLQGVRGLVAADVRVRGTWRAPAYAGRGALRGGALTLTSTGMQLTDAAADLSLVGDTLRLDSLVALAHGPLRASGMVDLSDRSRPYVRASASGSDVRVMNQGRGLVDADAEITAIGPLNALRVTGRGEMKGGYLALKQFRKDLLRVKAPGELTMLSVFDSSARVDDSARAAAARRIPRKVAIIADLSLVIDRGNYYRNRPDANTEFQTGDGEVVVAHIDQRSADQWIIGFVRIPGGVAFFRTQPFVPSRGSLTFGPHTNAVGIVQEAGERLLWEPARGWFPLQMYTGGTSKEPSIGLESGTLFPIRGRELNGYLTQGRTQTTLLQQSGSSLSGSASWSGQLSGETGALARRQQGATALGVVLHDIGTGTTKAYGLDAFSVSPADVPTELVFGKTGGVRGALVEGGRYLTTDRYLGAQLRLTTGIPGFRLAQRFGATYRLDLGLEPRFLFRAPEELGITHPTVRTGVFGAFLTRLWDF